MRQSNAAPTIALLPRSKGNQYFLTCEKGARSAAAELSAELLFDGPINTDPAKQNAAKQNEILENWISLGGDAIAVACENKDRISTATLTAAICGASLQFTSDETQKEATFLTLRAEASDNAAIFTTNSTDLSSRARPSSSFSGRHQLGTRC